MQGSNLDENMEGWEFVWKGKGVWTLTNNNKMLMKGKSIGSYTEALHTVFSIFLLIYNCCKKKLSVLKVATTYAVKCL